MKVDRSSHVPMYRQIADDLQQKIQDKYFEVGEQLPTEPVLMELYQVSRVTIRKSINLLVTDGLITIQRGKGMFVNAPVIETDVLNDILSVENFKGFYETLLDQGLDVNIKLLRSTLDTPPKNIAEALGCSPDMKVQKIERLFYIKDLPIAFHIGYISPNLYINKQKVLDNIEFQPLSTLIQEQSQNELEEIRCSIEVNQIPGDIAEYLHVPPRFPVLTLYRTFITGNSKPFISTLMYLSSDSYQFTIKNKGQNSKNK
ncbi:MULTISPECIES: GntR family transcriptional regulator [Virgibacillus]|uniref:HTH-type transcriptional repressor YvoA n=2 Tax=Virgibacillus TaxID=84406 RepID=A0A024Q8B0_9BACI|nr:MULTISPECIES: GntR family transcriptional regulator [Virgibacillus]EQB37736.1 hypothetical protein M948_04035 [Virgibacillus sp. CM-4]MYL40472.1 GntR family transcriptional regulator [Virgibacillus massiliensis]GGJ58747.1 GntR family transcriptional regulator [Virgibacillus kapii]CDQ38739.1 HTH-type transcriptional repressor YvoA [Virgibacillus massiliensis]